MTSPHARRGRAAFAAAMWGAAALLAGCAVPVPHPDAMSPAAPAQWTEAVPAGTRPLAQWWRVFGDKTLVDLVAAALAANTDIASAEANLRAARAARAEAAAALWPTVSASLAAQRNAGGQRTVTGNLFDAGLDASWEVDVFGANRHGVAAQDALVQASASTLAAVQVSVAAETALAYLDLRGAQVRIAVARENLASQEETLQLVRWRQQAGLATAVEVEQAITAVEQTRAQVPTLRAAASTAAHALAVLTGAPPSTLARLVAEPAPLPQPQDGVTVAIPAQALRRRPDLLAAEAQLRAAAQAVAQADARRRPRFDMGASLAWTGASLGSLGSAAAAGSLLASVMQPLFDGGQRDAQLAAREAQLDLAQAAYRAGVLKALQEAEDALGALDAARERSATLERALEAARHAALLASQRQAGGLVDFEVVLVTQRTLLAVQDGLATAQADAAAAHVRLYKALGGGWQRTGEEGQS
jgi:outer membrane protein, multidrug efflux system